MLTISREAVRPAAGVARRSVARYAVPGVLAMAWLAVVLTHRRMPYPSDQLHYLQAAANFPHPTSDMTHQMTRFGLTGPTRLVMTVFGYSETSYYFMPVLGGLLLLLGTYAIGAMLFSRVVGIAAAVVVTVYTPVFYDFTELLPDAVATGIFTVAVALAVAVRQRRLAAGPWVLLVIGLLLAWSYLVREFVVFVWPVVPVLLWPRLKEAGPAWRGLLWLAAPVVVLGAAETLLCWAVYGDPLARIRAVTGKGNTSAALDPMAATFRDKPRRVYAARLWAVLNGNEPTTYYAQQWVMRPLLAASVIGGVIGGVVRRGRLGIFLLWMALLWVPLTLLGGVIDPGHPKLRLQLIRYWFPLFPALVLGGVAAVWLALRYLHRRLDVLTKVTAVVPAVAVVGVAATAVIIGAREWSADATAFRGAGNMSDLRGWLSRNDRTSTVWTDDATAQVLAVYRQGPAGGRRWTAPVRRLGLDRPGPAPGDVVVFFDTDKGQICGHCRLHAGEALGNPIRPAPNWRQVYVNAEGVVRIYAVGPPG